MSKWMRVVGAVVLVGAMAMPSLAGTTYYVDIAASDTGSGGQLAPAKQVVAGVRYLKGPGDTLVIRPGQYFGSFELRGLKGEAGQPITLKGIRETPPPEDAARAAQAPARYAPLLRADKDRDNVILLKDCHYIVIENLLLTGARSVGLMLDGCSNITIRGCDIYENLGTQLVASGSESVTVEDCELAYSSVGHGCEFVASDKPTLRNCRVHHNAAAGVSVSADKRIAGTGNVPSVTIEDNIFFANGRRAAGVRAARDEKGREIRTARLAMGNAAICGDGVDGAVIRNNLVHHNWVGGIVLYRDFASRAGQHNRIVHNTIYLPDDPSAFGVYLAQLSQDTLFYNNVVVSSGAAAVWLGTGSSKDLQSDYNILFRLDSKDPMRREKEDLSLRRWQELYRQDRNSVSVAKPGFVDADNEDLESVDLRLAEDSKLAGRCVLTSYCTRDILGKNRPRDRVTPGCYELKPLEGDAPPTAAPGKTSTPPAYSGKRPSHLPDPGKTPEPKGPPPGRPDDSGPKPGDVIVPPID